MAEPTMEEYMTKIREDYGSRIARPKFDEKASFKLKGQLLKELRYNTFSGSDNEDANEHTERVLEIVDLFNMPVMENMNAYRDKEMGEVIVGKPFFREVCVKARRFNGFITIGKGHCVLVPAFCLLRFGSAIWSCVLLQDKLRFASRQVAFCLKTSCVLLQSSLRFAARHVAFCFKARCVLLQDSLRFASKLVAFCFKTLAF
nr:hypothetical protein [Tanacetum cinerariifolium]